MMAKMSHKTCRLAVALTVATVLVPALPLSAAVTYDTRALSGDLAPGTTGVFSIFGAPMIDGAGRTAFRSILLVGTGGVTSANRRGLWSEGSGSLSLVARDGSAAPGTGGVYNFLDTLVLNSAGQVAFFSTLLRETGDVTTANDRGIWSEDSGSLGLAAREGSAAPGTATGVVYSDIFNKPVLNGAGQIAFQAGLAGTGVTAANDEGIWSEGSGSLSLVARTGSAAPGTAGGVYSSLGGNPAFNNAGQTAFSGGLLAGSGDVTAENNGGIWSEGSGSLSLVARKGDAAPGAAGGVYGGFDDPALNSAGQTAFRGNLLIGTGGVTSDNNQGIWSEGSGSLSLIARTGSAAPGTDGVFNTFNGNPILNGAGQTAFNGILRLGTGGVTLANDRGIWATDPDGQLTLIVREGDLFDVNDDPLIDDFRTISTLGLVLTKTGGEDGRGTPFNDASQLVFMLKFTDNSRGIFVASIQADVAMLAGDLNGDGFVGIDDLNIILGNWNQTVPGGDLNQSILSGDPLAGDLNGDGFVGIDDLNVVLGNWNAGTPPAAPAVPEPASLALLGLGGLALTSRWRPPRTG